MSKKNLKIKTSGTTNTVISYGKSVVKTSNQWDVKLSWKDLKKVAKKAVKEGLSFEQFLCKVGLHHLQNEKAAIKLRKKFNALRESKEVDEREHELNMTRIESVYDHQEQVQEAERAFVQDALEKYRKSNGNCYVHCPTTGNTNKK